MRIRQAQLTDLPKILEIQAAAPEASCWSEAAWRSALDAPGSDCAWVAADPEAVAFLLVRVVDELEAEVLNIAVDPARRRRGLAEALLAAWLDSRSGDIHLEVRVSNHPAIALYRKLGFVEAGFRRAYYHSPVENAQLMKRTIKLSKREPKRD